MFVSISLFTLSLMGCCCSSPDTLSVDPSLRFTAMNPPVVYNFYFDRPTEENLMAVKEIISSSFPERPLLVGDDFVLVGFKEAEWTKRMKKGCDECLGFLEHRGKQ